MFGEIGPSEDQSFPRETRILEAGAVAEPRRTLTETGRIGRMLLAPSGFVFRGTGRTGS
jgi:hypothetical protein